MKCKKKNRFLNFILSLIPGAAHMYMGFMKMGLSLMVMFVAIFALSSLFNMGMLAYVAIIVWAYSFFHANNLVSADDEEFANIEDAYFFGGEAWSSGKIPAAKYHKYFGVGLLLFGLFMMWNSLMMSFFRVFGNILPHEIYEAIRFVWTLVPQFVLGVVIICLGVRMLRGKKKSLPEVSEDS